VANPLFSLNRSTTEHEEKFHHLFLASASVRVLLNSSISKTHSLTLFAAEERVLNDFSSAPYSHIEMDRISLERPIMTKKQRNDEKKIEPGMVVEATRGDLGEEDVSKPKVTEVVQDQQGKVDKLVVQKGVVFKKTLEIPTDRVVSINQEDSEDESVPGKVTVDVSKKEVEALTSVGAEALAPEQEHNLLDRVEKEVPTAAGLREIEASNSGTQVEHSPVQSIDENTGIPQEAKPLLRLDPIKLIFWANVLSGVLAPVLVVYLIVIGNNRKIMQKYRLGLITNIGLVMTALVMFTAAILLFYGLATGQGG
jgi:hypothetical protein